MDRDHEDNRKSWNVWARKHRDRSADPADRRWFADQEDRWRRCVGDPSIAFEPSALRMLRKYAGDLAGKRACVIASGDNLAVFALAGLGAEVTSVDQSERQLADAADRAKQLGLEIAFEQCDIAEMGPMPDDTYDLVTYSNGMMVWLSDLAPVFGQVRRILRPGGLLIGYDIHPFQRPWRDLPMRLEMEKDYWSSGPFDSTSVVELEDQSLTVACHEHHWTMADILNSLASAGMGLVEIAEDLPSRLHLWEGPGYPRNEESLLDWRVNQQAGLPFWLTIAARA